MEAFYCFLSLVAPLSISRLPLNRNGKGARRETKHPQVWIIFWFLSLQREAWIAKIRSGLTQIPEEPGVSSGIPVQTHLYFSKMLIIKLHFSCHDSCVYSQLISSSFTSPIINKSQRPTTLFSETYNPCINHIKCALHKSCQLYN